MGFFGTKTEPLDELRRALEQRPADLRLLMDMGALLRQRGQRDGAVDHYLQAAQVQWDAGHANKASAVARLALQVAPERVDAHEMLARCLEASHQIEDLRVQLRALLSLYRGTGHQDDATRVADRLAALGPSR